MDLLTALLSIIFEGVDPSLLLAGYIYLSFIGLGLGFTIMGLFLDVFDDLLDSVLGIFEGVVDVLESGESVMDFHGLGGLTIGSFSTSFGAVGLFMTIHNISPMISAPSSALISFIMSFIIFKVGCIVFREATLSTSNKELIGQEALVTVKIPAGGVGKIQFSNRGIRSLIAISGEDIEVGSIVTIIKIIGTEAFVKLKN